MDNVLTSLSLALIVQEVSLFPQDHRFTCYQQQKTNVIMKSQQTQNLSSSKYGSCNGSIIVCLWVGLLLYGVFYCSSGENRRSWDDLLDCIQLAEGERAVFSQSSLEIFSRDSLDSISSSVVSSYLCQEPRDAFFAFNQ